MRDLFNRMKPGEKESIPATCWIVEYVGAQPVPVYLDKDAEPTTDPWAGKKFTSHAEAYAWTQSVVIDFAHSMWTPVERTFKLGPTAMSEANRI